MENQHRKISGYPELNQEEIDLINKIKIKGQELGDLLQEVQTHLVSESAKQYSDGSDRVILSDAFRWKALAKTEFQKGVMFLVRAVAKPTDGM